MCDGRFYPPNNPQLRQTIVKGPQSHKLATFDVSGRSLSIKSLLSRSPKKQADPLQGEQYYQRTTTTASPLEEPKPNARMLRSALRTPSTTHESTNHSHDQPPHETASQASSVYSTDQTESTNEKSETHQHHRGESLHVKWTEDDVQRMASEIYEGTIVDVHMSLLTYWILEDTKNFDVAKCYIRELAVDQGYNPDREANVHIRKLLKDVKSMRPRQAKAPVLGKLKAPVIRSKASHATFRNSYAGESFADFQVLSSRQVQKEPKMEQSESKSPASTPTRDYPPNTPDRPAPLSIRSRTSNNTPTAGCRSVSLPVTCGRFEVGTDDVFGISHTSASSLQSTLVGEDTQASLTVTNTISVISQAQDDIDATKDDDTYSSEWFATSSSRSSLETASNESFHGSQTLYSYSPVTPASPTSEPQATIQDARQPADIHARLRIRVPSPLTNAPRFHRPLPLRNYESEAHLYPTSQAQGMSDHNRAISAGSMLHNSRPSSSSSRDARRRPLPMQLANIHVPPSLTRDAQHISPAQPHTAIRHSHSFSADESTGIEASAENERPVEAEDQDDRSSTSTYETYQSTSLSEALTLADFPIPPMQNPVGQLPMTTIRVLTRLDAAVNTGDINTSSTTAALATAYRTVAADIARLRDLLGQTRARGETLESVDWQTLSPFERAWREVNEDLLISIYGRQDTELTALDVEYVDLIARELRESASARWVHEVFCEEVEIF